MIVPPVEELVLSERKFLHEMANYILIAHGMTTALQKSLLENKTIDEKEIERFEKALIGINKMTTALKERRSYLHELSKELSIYRRED